MEITTNDFLNWLRASYPHEDLTERFLANIAECGWCRDIEHAAVRRGGIHNIVDAAFDWGSSPEGYDGWAVIHNTWEFLCEHAGKTVTMPRLQEIC